MKNYKKMGILFLILLFVLFFTLSGIFQFIKKEIILNNQIIIGNVLQNHPELEKEIVQSLLSINPELKTDILTQYGLTSLESLEYLESIQHLKYIYYGSFLTFFCVLFLGFSCFYFYNRHQQKEAISKIDAYLFSLLSEEIQVDLKDFQSGDLAILQNDLLKVTSRLKHALEHSDSGRLELAKNLQDISHQLKTPLTSLSILNEALETAAGEDKQKFLKQQEQVIEHMKTLIVNLLKVSQIESGVIPFKKEKFTFSKVIDSILLKLDVFLVSKNISVDKSIVSLDFVGDAYWLEEALLNIVKNALEHSEDNSKIEILLKDTPLFIELKIIDYGDGISEKDLPHIFERFYKSSSNHDSVGIGLNLSKTILDRMNATIRVKSKKGVGTTFIIHFYKGIV